MSLQQHIIDTILPKEKAVPVSSMSYDEDCGYNECLYEVHSKLPDIINCVIMHYNIEITKILHLYAMKTTDVETLNLIENIQSDVLSLLKLN
jgi:hypothetical protein